LMIPGFDFTQSLRELLEQVPVGMVTTPMHLAHALGDPVARRAVIEVIREKALDVDKVTSEPTGSVFSYFRSDQPLRRLTALQERRAEKAVMEDDFSEEGIVAGVDVTYRRDRAFAACVVMDGDMKVLEISSEVSTVRFPYIPGYLSFREGPAAEAVMKAIDGYDVLMVNGHGTAHPRRCGLATYLGIRLEKPTVGVAGGLLVGEAENGRSAMSRVIHDGVEVGAEIAREGHAPIYVSPGHRVSMASSVEIVVRMLGDGRLPEPLRLAHIEANRIGKIRSVKEG